MFKVIHTLSGENAQLLPGVSTRPPPAHWKQSPQIYHDVLFLDAMEERVQ